VPVAALAHQREHLLDEERIASRRVADARPEGVVELAAGEQRLDQHVGRERVERLEQRRRRVQLAAAPADPPVEQLRPRDAQEQDRRVTREIGDVLDQLEERRLAPMDVVEHDHERRRERDRLQQLAKRPRRLGRGRDHAIAPSSARSVPAATSSAASSPIAVSGSAPNSCSSTSTTG